MKTIKTLGVALVALVAMGGSATAAQPAATETTAAAFKATVTTERLDALNEKSLEELEALFDSGTNDGPVPVGQGIGKAFFTGVPGLTELGDELRRAGLPSFMGAENLIASLVWHGKTFSALPGSRPGTVATLTNKVLGLDLASADVWKIDESENADEARTFYLDYSRSNLPLVRGIQDYIRRIDDGLYIGKAFIKIPGTDRRVLGCYFALDFNKTAE
jgi:hypothetical protein